MPRARALSLGVIGCITAGAAHAQVAASATLESDYRFRGVSLSDGNPNARLSVAYDHPAGFYAGAMASEVRFAPGSHPIEVLGYLGYVTRWSSGLSAEAGLTTAAFAGDHRYDYSELYIGAAGERWSARGYYSPSYFGFAQRTLYLELDVNTPFSPRWRAVGHIGALTALGAPAAVGSDDGRGRTRYDGRLGMAYSVTPSIDAQLAWVTATRAGPYVVEYRFRSNALVLSATASF